MTNRYKKFSRFGLNASAASVALGIIFAASPAFAQAVPADEAADDNVIIVTGSRITSPNAKSISPIAVVSAKEFTLQGDTRVENILNNMPQVTYSQGQSDNNGATGIATVSLRNLGAERTLVLIDGRRLGPGDPASPLPDLNMIPSALVKRVDVLTGGASSVYGSDAVAGVVNFVMEKNFEGIQLDGQMSVYQHDNDYGGSVRDALDAKGYGPRGNKVDGTQKNVALTIGSNLGDGRGNVTAYATWRKSSAVTQAARDFSYCGLANASATDFACAGSSTSANGRFLRLANIGTATQPVYAPTGGSFTLDPGTPGALRPYDAGRDGYNFNPLNYLQRPDERFSLGAFAHYEISPALQPYLDVMFMDDRTVALGAPSGAFFGGSNFFVNCDSPLLGDVAGPGTGGLTQRQVICGPAAGTSAVQGLYIGKRNVEGGPRVTDLRHTDYRIVTGLKGELSSAWSYDAYAQMNRAIYSQRYNPDFSTSRLQNSLITTTNGAGQVVCQSAVPNANGLITDPNCVPYNIFTPGGVNQAQLDYLQVPGTQNGSVTEYVASASLTGNLGEYGFQSPWAEDGIGIAIGAEYRKNVLEINYDQEYKSGDLAGAGLPFGIADAKGTITVKEFFGELSVPLISDKPFFDVLNVNASYRHSSYNLSGSTDAYRLGAEWAPIPDVRFRAGYNRAVRAPNVYDLFQPAYLILGGGADPCAGDMTAPGAPTLAQCRNSFFTNGVQTTPDSAYGNIDENPAFQYNTQTSGFAGLKPEISDTYTLGVVIAPQSIRNLTISIDAFDIRIKKTISSLSGDFVLAQCITGGNPFFCQSVNRAQGSGSLWYGNGFTDTPTLNLGALRTRGIDIAAAYQLNLSQAGSLGFNFAGTYVDKLTTTPISGANSVGSYDCVGLYGPTCGVPTQKWRHQARVTYTAASAWSLSLNWRYFSKVKLDLLSTQPLLNVPGSESLDDHIKAFSFFDLSAQFPVADKFTLRLGVNNVFDKSPPIVTAGNYGTAGNGNTFPGIYDAMGRYLFAGFTLKL